MTQEMCKDFLAGSSNGDTAAKQRYVLYMKATSLWKAEDGIWQARLNVLETGIKLSVFTFSTPPPHAHNHVHTTYCGVKY